MKSYGQFCSIARTEEALAGRWTLLIIRELLCGSRRFNDIRRAVPRISRTVLSDRLKALESLRILARRSGKQGPEYELTEAGKELQAVVSAFAAWGQRWLPRDTAAEDLDLEPLLLDMRRRIRFEALPKDPLVARFELDGFPRRFLLLKSQDAAVCDYNPGFPESLCVRGPLAPLVAWWRGDIGFLEARRGGLRIDGPRTFIRAFPGWFERYAFADIAPAQQFMSLRS